MKREFLGDTYDAVKRLWRDVLQDWAPLYFEPRFVPDDLREEFARLTGIPVLEDGTAGPHTILNDPDTGIRLPGTGNQAEGRTHITVPSVASQLRMQGVRCVITFDQSDYRGGHLDRRAQRQIKLGALREEGFDGFYYVSHAPFLFAAPDRSTCAAVWRLLTAAGLPVSRLEALQERPGGTCCSV